MREPERTEAAKRWVEVDRRVLLAPQGVLQVVGNTFYPYPGQGVPNVPLPGDSPYARFFAHAADDIRFLLPLAYRAINAGQGMGFDVGSMLEFGGETYCVSGIYPGAEGCVSLVGLTVQNRGLGNVEGHVVEELLVPRTLLETAVLVQGEREAREGRKDEENHGG